MGDFQSIKASESQSNAAIRESVREVADRLARLEARILLAEERSLAEPDTPFIAIVGALSPEATGVAYYTTRSFAFCSKSIKFFSEVKNPQHTLTKQNLLKNYCRADAELFAIEQISKLKNFISCEMILFILGNSQHFVTTLQAAAMIGKTRAAKALYVHEANLLELLLSFFHDDRHSLNERLSVLYADHDRVGRSELFGLRLIVALTGCTSFVCNSHRCACLINDELQEFVEYQVEVVFLPILPIDALEEFHFDASIFRIGHFGGFGITTKGPGIVFNVAKQMAENRPTRLLFAGRGCNGQFTDYVDPDLVDWIDAPSDSQLLSLMRSMDVIIQPREMDHGESSGVINQAISVGKIPITSAGTAADDLGSLVITVPKGAPVSTWLSAIDEAAKRQASGAPSHEHRSIAAFGPYIDGAISRIVDGHRTLSPT